MKKNYPKVTGYWVYCHITPNGMFYIGKSKMATYIRWCPSHYRKTTLYYYIEKYGWDNIRHVVLKDGLTKEQALILEGLLIDVATDCGWCINKQGSGGKWSIYLKESQKKYKKVWYNENKDRLLKERQIYSQTEYGKMVHKKAVIKYESKLENKIYKRVSSYNRYHPNKIKETPLEAKQKYLQCGYIPSYIKNDDLS